MKITRPSNVRPAPRPGFVGGRVGPGSMVVDAWMPSEVNAISPFVDQLLRLIEGSPCVAGNESAVELALREALNNAVIHGNHMEADKLVQVHCRCERGAGISLTVKDQGNGFDPTAVADPLTLEALKRENGRGIHLMKSAMDEVSFNRAGTEVYMRKKPARCESRAK